MDALQRTKSAAMSGSDEGIAGAGVYDAVRRDIIEGRLAPGAKLRVAELMERYGSGMNPTREALKRLTGEVLVVHSEQRGFSVMPVSAEDLHDLTRARMLIVGAAVRRSVETGDAQWEERVLLAWHRLRKSQRYLTLEPLTANPDYDALHLDLHLALTSGVDSAWLQDAERRLFQQSERYRHLTLRLIVQDREEEHEAIVAAALARKAEEAAQLAEHHIQRTCQMTLDAIQRTPGGTTSRVASRRSR